jgi:hypothetical protein
MRQWKAAAFFLDGWGKDEYYSWEKEENFGNVKKYSGIVHSLFIYPHYHEERNIQEVEIWMPLIITNTWRRRRM